MRNRLIVATAFLFILDKAFMLTQKGSAHETGEIAR